MVLAWPVCELAPVLFGAGELESVDTRRNLVTIVRSVRENVSKINHLLLLKSSDLFSTLDNQAARGRECVRL